MSTSKKLTVEAITQIGIMVRDVEKSVERYRNELGIGPWRIFEFGPRSARNVTVRGEPAQCTLRVATAMVGDIMLELIQPLTGPGPQQEFLDQHGEGVHHLAVSVKRLDEATETMRDLGYEEVFGIRGAGPKGDRGALYFDTAGTLGTTLELIGSPSEVKS